MQRLDPFRTWLLYRGGESLASGVAWTLSGVYFVRDVHMSPLQLILAGTALEVGYFLFEVPTGVVADRYSRRASIVIGDLVMGACTIGIGLTHSFPLIAALSAVEGFGWTFKSGADDAWLADEIGLDNIGRAYQGGAQVGRVAGLVGIAASVGFGVIDLRWPLVVGGAAWMGLAATLAVWMPERGFRPATDDELGRAQALTRTATAGARLIRARPILLLIVGITLFGGLWSEGVDRLWEAHLIRDVHVPGLASLSPIVWFGVISAGATLLAIAVAHPLRGRLERAGPAGMARTLFVVDGVLVVATLGFALAGSFALALAAFWVVSVARSIGGPISSAWLNVNIDDSRVRATVISMTALGDSVGEWAGGPALGVVGNAFGIRAALAAAGASLSPALLLYARAIRHHGTEPELEELPQAVEAGA